MTARYWFRPKRYGFGATPATWEGWAFTGLMVASVAVASWLLLGRGAGFGIAGAIVWAVLFVALIVGFIIVTKAKTEGAWRWRWGDPE
jgi:hypothetical protein